MYLDSIRFTLFFYIITSLIEAFCVAFYKLRNTCGVKPGQLFSKEKHSQQTAPQHQFGSVLFLSGV